jgi:hypothetical protein
MRLHFSVFLALALCGCTATMPENSTENQPLPTASTQHSFDLPTRDNALALLDDLLNDEKHLNLILLIKHASPELKLLVKNISETAGNGAERLKTLMKADASLLRETNLPLGEKATRDAISKIKEHLLLHSKGAEFKFQLVLTQAEALNYGSSLAQVAAQNEPNPERVREFSNLSVQFNQLHEEVLAMLRH